MSKITVWFEQIFSVVAKIYACKMAETEKEEVESPLYDLVAMGFNIRWQHINFIFNFIINIVQLYKEDCIILWIS